MSWVGATSNSPSGGGRQGGSGGASEGTGGEGTSPAFVHRAPQQQQQHAAASSSSSTSATSSNSPTTGAQRRKTDLFLSTARTNHHHQQQHAKAGVLDHATSPPPSPTSSSSSSSSSSVPPPTEQEIPPATDKRAALSASSSSVPSCTSSFSSRPLPPSSKEGEKEESEVPAGTVADYDQAIDTSSNDLSSSACILRDHHPNARVMEENDTSNGGHARGGDPHTSVAVEVQRPRKMTQDGLIEITGGRPTVSGGSAHDAARGFMALDRVKRAITEAAARGASALSLEELGILNLPADISVLAGTLEELNLERNALTSLPSEIGQLTLLDNLQLYKNLLESLPPEIGQLQNLTRLFLNRNSLSSLPPEIAKLQSLVWLSLDHNKFTSLPREIGMLKSLEWLSVEDNQLSTLPTELSQLTKLEYLSIYNNAQITSLPLCMFSFKNLRCFRANQFFQVPKELLTGGTSVLIQHYLLELGRLEAHVDPASTTAHWVSDDTVDDCRSCTSAFSKLNRRHHCRLCGWVFCGKCTSKRLPIPQLYFMSAVRVCESCFDLLSPAGPALSSQSPSLSSASSSMSSFSSSGSSTLSTRST